MPLPLVQDQPDESSYQGLVDRLPTTMGQQVATTFKSEFGNAVTSRVVDHFALQAVEKQGGQKTLSQEELAAKYQDLGINWDGPKKEGVAEFIANKRRQEMYDEQKIQAGPQGFLSKGMRFGAGVVAHMVDPTEAALTIGTAGLFRMGLAARYGVAAMESAGLLGRVAIGAGEGVATQVALEPVQQMSDREFQRDFNSVDVLHRLALGAAMGAAFEGAAYGAGRLLRKMTKTEAHVEAHDAAVTQLATERPLNVDPIAKDFEHERSGVMNEVPDYSGRTRAPESKVFDPAHPEGHKVYHGTLASLEDFHAIPENTRGAEGWIDHVGIANADAASKWNRNGIVGNVFEKEMAPTARIISTSEKLGHNETNLLQTAISNARRGELPAMGTDAIKTAFEGIARDIRDKKVRFNTLNDLFDYAREKYGMSEEQLFKRLEPELEKVGFHGMHIYDAERGVNRFEFFEKSLRENGSPEAPLFKSEQVYKGDPRLVPEVTPETASETIQKQMDPHGDAPYTKQEVAKTAEIGNTVPKDDAEMDTFVSERARIAMEEIKSMNDAGQLRAEDAKELEDIGIFEKISADIGKALKEAANCVLSNG